MRAYRVAALLVTAAAAYGAEPGWPATVSPILTPAEKKIYLALPAADRAAFEENFWAGRSIDREEYARRMAYIDAKFGSSKAGSGANTDPGRVYLSLGAPARIAHIPSSRIFVPLEIWYYDSAPGLTSSELRLLFYQPNGTGLPKLYSPTVDTMRALLLPEASTVHMFGPNDSVTERDIRQNLKTGPAEDEVITAASGVAPGIKYSGNDEILGRVTSPEIMLMKARTPRVTSRFIARPVLDVLKTASMEGAWQVDLRLVAAAQKEIGIEVLRGFASIYHSKVNLKFAKTETVEYTHRLDLLAGRYRLVVTVDGASFPYPLEVEAKAAMGEIVRADSSLDQAARRTPFEFEGRELALNPAGRVALVAVPQAGRVAWTIREGLKIVWRATVDADRVALLEIPALPPGTYRLEASMGGESRSVDLVLPAAAAEGEGTRVSYNANLAPAGRLAFIGNQWLLRGEAGRAREVLALSLAKGETKEAQVALARLDAMAGNLDAARARVRGILAARPNDFEALAVFAYIETRFQDYPAAAELYRRALAVEDSAALRSALAALPNP